jgi:hypothetical protein
MMPEQVWYRTKLTQSGIVLVRYRTKIWDAGMLMPALVSSMPMPSYDICICLTKKLGKVEYICHNRPGTSATITNCTSSNSATLLGGTIVNIQQCIL